MTVVRLFIGLVMIATAALPALASSEEGGGLGAELIQPKIGTILWTVVTFVIMAIILGRYAWKPLMGAIDSREKSIRDSIDQAAQDRAAAETILTEQRQVLVEARRERAEAVAAGQRDAERLREEILAEARVQREQLLQQTQEQVQAGLRQARNELRGVAADLVIRAAEKLLVKNLDDATQRKLVEDYLSDLDGAGDSNAPPS